jgi:hypothetical protein
VSQAAVSLIVSISQLILAGVIGAVTVYIAWQQWRTNRNQFRLHLFDRRIVIYDAALELAARVVYKGTVTQEELWSFMRKACEASLFFDDKIQAYCQELLKNGFDLITANEVVEAGPDAPNYKDMVQMKGSILKWFRKQSDKEAKPHFEPFLRIRE